jgi:hypothetical protein
MPNPVRAFIDLNRKACARVASHLPHTKARIFAAYEETAGRWASVRPGQIVLDVGGGAQCVFIKNCTAHPRIVTLDISREELNRNRDVREKVVSDASRALPFADGSVDVVLSSCVVEHLSDVLILSLLCFKYHRLRQEDFGTQVLGYSALAFASGSLVIAGLNSRVFAEGGRILGMFGKYSYGMYLFHRPIVAALRGLLSTPRLAIGSTDFPRQVVVLVVGISITTAIAVLSWHLYEQPFLRLKRFFE